METIQSADSTKIVEVENTQQYITLLIEKIVELSGNDETAKLLLLDWPLDGYRSIAQSLTDNKPDEQLNKYVQNLLSVLEAATCNLDQLKDRIVNTSIDTNLAELLRMGGVASESVLKLAQILRDKETGVCRVYVIELIKRLQSNVVTISPSKATETLSEETIKSSSKPPLGAAKPTDEKDSKFAIAKALDLQKKLQRLKDLPAEWNNKKGIIGCEVESKHVYTTKYGDYDIVIVHLNGRSYVFLNHILLIEEELCASRMFTSTDLLRTVKAQTIWRGSLEKRYNGKCNHTVVKTFQTETLKKYGIVFVEPGSSGYSGDLVRLQELMAPSDKQSNLTRFHVALVQIADQGAVTAKSLATTAFVLGSSVGTTEPCYHKLFEDVSAEWNGGSYNGNLEKSSEDIGKNNEKNYNSFAEFIRELVIPGYMHHRPSQNKESITAGGTGLIDDSDLLDKITSVDQLFLPSARFCDPKFCNLLDSRNYTAVDKADIRQKLENRVKDFDNKLGKLLPKLFACEESDFPDTEIEEPALPHLSYIKVTHKKRCPSCGTCSVCPAAYQQLCLLLNTQETCTSKGKKSRHRALMRKQDYNPSKKGRTYRTAKNNFEEFRRFLACLMYTLKKHCLLQDFESDLFCMCLSSKVAEVFKWWVLRSAVYNVGRGGKKLKESTLQKKKSAVLDVMRAIKGHLDRFLKREYSTSDQDYYLKNLVMMNKLIEDIEEIPTYVNGTDEGPRSVPPHVIGECPTNEELKMAEEWLRSKYTIDELLKMETEEALHISQCIALLGICCRGLGGRNGHYVSFSLHNIYTVTELEEFPIKNAKSDSQSFGHLVCEKMREKKMINGSCVCWHAMSVEDATIKAKWKKTVVPMGFNTSLVILDHTARLTALLDNKKVTMSPVDRESAKQYLRSRDATNYRTDDAWNLLREWCPVQCLRKTKADVRMFFPRGMDVGYKGHNVETYENDEAANKYSDHIRRLLRDGMKLYLCGVNDPRAKSKPWENYKPMAIRSMVACIISNYPEETKKIMSDLVFLNCYITQLTVYDRSLQFPVWMHKFMDDAFPESKQDEYLTGAVAECQYLKLAVPKTGAHPLSLTSYAVLEHTKKSKKQQKKLKSVHGRKRKVESTGQYHNKRLRKGALSHCVTSAPSAVPEAKRGRKSESSSEATLSSQESSLEDSFSDESSSGESSSEESSSEESTPRESLSQELSQESPSRDEPPCDDSNLHVSWMGKGKVVGLLDAAGVKKGEKILVETYTIIGFKPEKYVKIYGRWSWQLDSDLPRRLKKRNGKYISETNFSKLGKLIVNPETMQTWDEYIKSVVK